MDKTPITAKDIQKYWSNVISIAFNVAWDKAEMKALIMGIAALVIGFACLGLILVLVGIKDMLISNRNDEIIGGTFLIIGSLSILGIFFISMIIRTPVEKDIEKQEKLNKWEAPEIKATKISTHIQIQSDNQGIFGFLEIYNGENYDLSKCYANMIFIMIETNGEWADITDSIKKNTTELTWPMFINGREVTIKRGTSERLNVVKTNSQKDRMFYIFKDGDQPIYQGYKKQLIKISIDGYFLEKHIESINFYAYVGLITQPIFETQKQSISISLSVPSENHLFIERIDHDPSIK
jgi:hypothetical protein